MLDKDAMKVRPATSADVDALIRIGRLAPTAPQWSRNQYVQLFRPDANRATIVLVIEESSDSVGAILDSSARILGFLVASQVQSDWELENIVVDPSAARHGLATQLLSELCSRAAAAAGNVIFLEVRASNSAARSLYEKRGFVPAGIRKNYYSHPVEDAILYRRSC